MVKSRISFFCKRNKEIIFIIFLHLLITVPLAYLLNVWYDEACSLSTSSGSIIHTIKRSLNFEYQPPFYFVLLNLWRKLDSSYFFARLLSIVFSSASLFVSYRFIRKYLKVSKAGLVTFLIAVNPFLIIYALEIRLYTLIVFLSAVLIFLMYEIYFFDNKSKVYRVVFVLLSIISLYTQYYTGFLIFGIGVSVLIYKGWNKFKVYLIDMIFPLLSLIGLIPFFSSIPKQITLSGEVTSGLTVFGLIEFCRRRIVSYLFAVDLSALAFLSRYEVWLFIFLLSIIFLFSIKNQLKEFIKIISFKEYSVLPVVIVVLLFFVLMVIKFDPEMAEIRHTAVMFLPLIYVTASLMFLTSNKKFLLFWFSLFIFLYSSALVKKFPPPLAKEGDAIRVSKYLKTNEKPDELIFTPYNIIAMPLRVHYNGVNQIISLHDSLLTEESEDVLIKQIDNESGYCWWDFPYPDPTWEVILKQIKQSRKFIDDNFIVIDKKYFKEMELWYIKRKMEKPLKGSN